MKNITLASVLLSLVFWITGCSESYSEKLTLTGSSTVAPLAAELARRFEGMHPNVRIDVQTGGSSRGVNDARKGLADIGMASRPLKSSEQDLQPYTIAWDGVTLILHADNPVRALTRSQMIDIYTGKITNWKQVGGRDAPIIVVNKAEGHSTLELFLKYFQLKNSDIKAHVVIGDNQQGLKTVAGNPNAIGYVSIGAAAYEADHGAPIQLLSIDGITASLGNVQSGAFPIARPLNLVTIGTPSKLAQQFIGFAQSPDVNDLIQQQFFVPNHAQE